MKLLFLGCKGLGILRTIITGAAYGLRPMEMQPAFTNNHISSSMNFWYLWGMAYGLCTIDGPVVGTFISNRLVLLTSVEDLNMMLSNSFSSKAESLALATCGICAPSNTPIAFLNYCALVGNLILVVWLGVNVGLFLKLSCNFSVLVHDILPRSVLSISIGFNIPNMVALGT